MTNQTPVVQSRFPKILSRLLPIIIVMAVVSGSWFVVQHLNSNDSTDEDAAEAETDAEGLASDVVLTNEKVARARFVTEASSLRKITDVRTVSGRLTYDESQHIEVIAPVSGVLADVLVTPGDYVSEGQLLAIIDSPEIGRARAAVLNEQAKYAVILTHVERMQEVTNNLRDLFALLDKNATPDVIQQEFSNRYLGTGRADIMAAYSERILANQLSVTAEKLTESGGLSMKTVRERENGRHVAEAKFRAVRETAAFDNAIRLQQLEAERDDAKRQVMIAQNHLATLLGYPEENSATTAPESLSRMEVRAPFAGTIESRSLAKRERVQASDSLFVLANTESLYVSADIRENEWAAMSIQPGQEIEVTAPAMPDRRFVATVHYIGREVMAESNSLPLVATIANTDGLLRPGMFVRVTIPVSQSGDVVAVPPGSVLQHENQQFVFVALDNDRFRRVGVQTGVGNEQWIEIASGLDVGQPVVTNGAFLLKSELLLSGEE